MGCSHPERSRWRPSDKGLRLRLLGFVVAAFGLVAAASVAASPAIVMDVATGNVLYEEQATQPWYPASLTKLMTVYIALSAVRDHQISLDTPLVVSARAASMAPSKMGFAPGTEVTLGNALKMLVVKSANDIAVTVAEGIAGSVDAFAEDMNRAAAQLGMTETHFVNPNGLHDPEHVSSARDLALLARALFVNFPDSAGLYGIGALRLGNEIIPTHNNLLGRYPGADGMKTGFTCAAGFNLVASAERGGHHYIAVVLGAPSAQQRLVRMAVLLDRAFTGIDHPHTLSAAGSMLGTAPDMHNEICRRRGKAVAAFEAETERLEAPLASLPAPSAPFLPINGFLLNSAVLTQQAPIASRIAMVPAPVFDPVPVFIGPAPGYEGPVAEARPPHSPIGTEPEPGAATTHTAGDASAKPGTAAQKSEKKIGKLAGQPDSGDDEDADTAPPTKAPAKKPFAKAAAAEKPQLDKAREARTPKAKTKEAKIHKAKAGKAVASKAKAGKAAASKAKIGKVVASEAKIGKVVASEAKIGKVVAKAKTGKMAGKAKTAKLVMGKAKPAKLAAKPKPAKPASAPD